MSNIANVDFSQTLYHENVVLSLYKNVPRILDIQVV